MIKFQIDNTTPEQSKLLLELGVPAWTSNMLKETDGGSIWKHIWVKRESEDGYDPIDYQKFLDRHEKHILPCWSALRLMEIIDICELGENSDPNTEEYPSTIKVMNKLHIPYVEYLVKSIERAVQLGTIDFSKLEE